MLVNSDGPELAALKRPPLGGGLPKSEPPAGGLPNRPPDAVLAPAALPNKLPPVGFGAMAPPPKSEPAGAAGALNRPNFFPESVPVVTVFPKSCPGFDSAGFAGYTVFRLPNSDLPVAAGTPEPNKDVVLGGSSALGFSGSGCLVSPVACSSFSTGSLTPPKVPP